jgi:hypothetical protein
MNLEPIRMRRAGHGGWTHLARPPVEEVQKRTFPSQSPLTSSGSFVYMTAQTPSDAIRRVAHA